MNSVLLSFVLGFIGAYLVSHYGNRLGLVDWPNERSSHSEPISKGGGIGILAAFYLLALWNGLSTLLWLPAVLLSLVSLFGDRFDLSATLRLVIQFVSAGAVCLGIMTISPCILGEYGVGFPFGLVIAVIFIVATANIFNFMDGIDGLASVTGALAFCLLAFSGWLRDENPGFVALAAGMAAACVGFLPFNFPRARVFMGDVGSILLGFVFTFYVVAWSRTLADLLMFGMFLFPFYADEFFTLISRLQDGDSLIRPHRRHIYQIMANQMKIPHWKTSLLYGTIQLAISGGAILLHPLGWSAELAWFCLVLGASWVLALRVRHYEND